MEALSEIMKALCKTTGSSIRAYIKADERFLKINESFANLTETKNSTKNLELDVFFE